MESTPDGTGVHSDDMIARLSLYSNYVRTRLFGPFISSSFNLIGKVPHLFGQTARPRAGSRGACLPLQLPSGSLDSSAVFGGTSRVHTVLEDITENVFLNLHEVQNNLQFWQSRGEGSDARRMYFMILERGPFAFIDGTLKLIKNSVIEGAPMQHLSVSASVHISERISILNRLRCSLATFLAQIYVEVDRTGEQLTRSPESLPALLVKVNGLFLSLGESLNQLQQLNQNNFAVDGGVAYPLVFEIGSAQQTESGVSDIINLLYHNLDKLDSFVSSIVNKYKKPRKMAQYWIKYSCGAAALAFGSMWLIKHSRLSGSSDIDNWIQEAKDSTTSFFGDHVEQPLLAIRDELFETFRKRHRGVMDHEEVQLTANSLHRMLLTFGEQTKGQKLPENATDLEMLEIVMSRYEKELTHPIQNLVGGELARALLIQVQKLKLDIETAMLELNQILRANEINFAILAALPAFFLSFLLLMVIRSWLTKDTKAEGRGRVARVQRRLLLVEIENRIMQHQSFIDQGSESEAQCMYGLMVYSLGRLYHAVEKHARATGEWQWLKQDIMDLAKPSIDTENKFKITFRMERMYDCLLPSLRRQ